MTQPGETDGLDVSGHVRAVEAQLASRGITRKIFSSILAQDELEPSPLVDYYKSQGAEPVICNKIDLCLEDIRFTWLLFRVQKQLPL